MNDTKQKRVRGVSGPLLLLPIVLRAAITEEDLVDWTGLNFAGVYYTIKQCGTEPEIPFS